MNAGYRTVRILAKMCDGKMQMENKTLE